MTWLEIKTAVENGWQTVINSFRLYRATRPPPGPACSYCHCRSFVTWSGQTSRQNPAGPCD